MMQKLKFFHRAPNAIRLDGERNLIGRRTESDWTADGIRSGGGRDLIGRRTRAVEKCWGLWRREREETDYL